MFGSDQLTWERKPRQDVLSLFAQFSPTVSGMLNWLEFEQRDYTKKAGLGYDFPFHSMSEMISHPLPQTTLWRAKMSSGLWMQHQGLVGKRRSFVEDQSKSWTSNTKQTGAYQRISMSIGDVCHSLLVPGCWLLHLSLWWLPWKKNSNVKATKKLTGYSRLPFLGLSWFKPRP